MDEDFEHRRMLLPETEVEIALLDWGGDGPLALLHHANGFCAGVWGPVASELRKHFRVVAMDARGHGDSSVPADAGGYRWELFGRDLAAVARALAAEDGTGRVALGVGHSFGGTAFVMAAAQEPALFERIALFDPVLFPPAGTREAAEMPRRGDALAEAARKRRHIWPSRTAAGAKWAGKPLFAGWDPRVLELYLAEGMRDRPDGQVELKCSPEVEAMIFESGQGFEIWPIAEKVTVPTLLVRARQGNFPHSVYAELASRIAEAELREVDTGHLVPMERPDLVVAELLAFAGVDIAG